MRAIVFATWCFACSNSMSPAHSPDAAGSGSGHADAPSGLLPPIDSGDAPDWKVIDPAAAGLDADKLEAARAYGFKPEFRTQGIVVIRNGYLVAEWYAGGANAMSYATSWSMAKSFTSTLVGLALDSGAIPSINQPMTTYFPEWIGTDKAGITLRDVLTMSSGLDWSEDYNDLTSDAVKFEFDSNPLALAMGQPVRDPHGSKWSYSSGDSMLLSRVLSVASGKSAEQLAREQIAGPLGMSSLQWWKSSQGDTFTPCCVDATSRDFARFGELYLQRGVWGGHAIVPSAWIDAATSSQAPESAPYGYQWWLNRTGGWPSAPSNAYFALGVDVQLIGVFPDQHMVIVRNGKYTKPNHAPVADSSLFAAGMMPGGFLSTGTVGPDMTFDEDTFFRLFLEAIKN